MPMIANGETMHKVVLLGPRGAATHLLEHRPREWKAEKWWRSDGQGEPGEPPMDGASFNESFTADGAKHRAYFFAHGISVDDFDRSLCAPLAEVVRTTRHADVSQAIEHHGIFEGDGHSYLR